MNFIFSFDENFFFIKQNLCNITLNLKIDFHKKNSCKYYVCLTYVIVNVENINEAFRCNTRILELKQKSYLIHTKYDVILIAIYLFIYTTIYFTYKQLLLNYLLLQNKIV